MLRKPAVAGMFYPDDSEELVKTIEDCFLHSFGPGKIPDIESFDGTKEELKEQFHMMVEAPWERLGYDYFNPLIRSM